MSQSPPLATVGMRMQDVGFQTQGPFCCGGRGPGEAEWRPLLGEHEDGRGAPGSGPKEGAERSAGSPGLGLEREGAPGHPLRSAQRPESGGGLLTPLPPCFPASGRTSTSPPAT